MTWACMGWRRFQRGPLLEGTFAAVSRSVLVDARFHTDKPRIEVASLGTTSDRVVAVSGSLAARGHLPVRRAGAECGRLPLW